MPDWSAWEFRLTNYHYLRLNLAKTLRSTISHLWRESWDLQQYLCLGFTSHVSFRGRHHFIPTDTAAIEHTLPRVPAAGHGRGGICAAWELDCGGRAWILTHMAVLIKRKGTILPVKLDSCHYSLFSSERGVEVEAYTMMQNSALLAELCLH